MGYTGLMENSTKVLNIAFVVPRHILVMANRYRRPNTESKFSFVKSLGIIFYANLDTRNSNNFSIKTPNHNGSPSVRLKHTVRIKSLGMKQIDKTQMGLQK